jgi:hypothetical protein
MVPVVMLVIDTCALSSIFWILLCLTVACSSFEHILVVYLLTVALIAKLLMIEDAHRIHRIVLKDIIAIGVMAHLTLSLSTNIFATSIIALKAWCVCVDDVFE